MNHHPDKPEVISEEYKTNEPYSQYHYYQSEAQFCKIFGCGKELDLQERLAGDYCYTHQGHSVIEKQSLAMLMRIQEVKKDMDWELENLHTENTESVFPLPIPSCK